MVVQSSGSDIYGTSGSGSCEPYASLSHQALQKYNEEMRTYMLLDNRKKPHTQHQEWPARGAYGDGAVKPSNFVGSAEPYFHDYGCPQLNVYDRNLQEFDSKFGVQTDYARNPPAMRYPDLEISQLYPDPDYEDFNLEPECSGLIAWSLMQNEALQVSEYQIKSLDRIGPPDIPEKVK